jgi:class 3 adenylate cyclase/CHASE2 domain-containing sensor protein
MRRVRTLCISLVLAACASLAAALFYLAPLNSAAFANRIADYRIHADIFTHPRALGFANASTHDDPNDDLALITIDEESIGNMRAGLGTFPFPRAVYGKLLTRLAQAGAKSVAFDIDFLEPSADPKQDAAFARAAFRIPATIGYAVTTTSAGVPGAELPPPALRRALRFGFTSIDTPGGIVIGQPPRLAPMPPGFPQGAAESLALTATQQFRGKTIDVRTLPSLNGVLLTLPFSVLGAVDITQRAGAQTTAVPFVSGTLSFADALTVPIDQLRLFSKGKIVVVGATAQALSDFAPTASGLYPGVFVHARLIDQLLAQTYIRPAPDWLDLLLIVALPLLLAAAFSQLRPPVAIALAAVAIVAYVEINAALFIYTLYWLDLLHAAGAMLLGALLVIAYRVLTESAERRFVTDLFGRHVSPALVEGILRSDDPQAALALSGKLVKATIFYSDIRGFTNMSERMTPQAIYDQLNEYFEAMCVVIFKYGGYVDKFIGDCIMVAFSAPVQTPDDARNAVDAAIEQQRVIRELGERWRAQGKEPFTVGMGINTGRVVMGNLGSSSRMNYTVIGDDVNIAARLYNVALGGQIIISESTYAEVKDFFEVRELDPVVVKGKSAPLRTYEVLGRRI